ncbi:TIGR03503 family protein [Shewanella cyperi]|uniref:TIGR03503 family protein n=1 Tax=Shewanella cyperi TaxID=2814292 RepID=A0A974XNC2_9GAMM|nr:TIGR03503 family protein [Shewanella cyperi]QSX31582.1 TIGR03503 family protein [Shewanella cyperi]
MTSRLLSVLLFALCCLTARADVVPKEQASELKNRFRIDHMVDELTLVVQREYGSAPVIVVQPDGSKWYASRHPQEVKWVDGITGDIITIPQPQPGPWQLLGRVVKGSRILKVSKLNIEVDPLPQPLFQGERIKVVAKLMGDEQRLRMPGLDYLVEWTARFVSDHQPGDENFAAGTVTVGSYKDDGEALDERPDDGVFTGDINLNQPWGHYEFQVRARNNVFERELEMPFVLSPMPVSARMLDPEDPQSGHYQMELNVDDSQLRLADTHFEFEMVGPAGLQLPVSMHGMPASTAVLDLPVVSLFGSYRLKGQVFSTSTTGRELVIKLPEMFFNLIEPPAPPPSPEELAARAAAAAALAEEQARAVAIKWIIAINIVLLVLGIAGIIFWRKRQAMLHALAAAEAKLQEEKAAKQTKSNTELLDEIDLTMPED